MQIDAPLPEKTAKTRATLVKSKGRDRRKSPEIGNTDIKTTDQLEVPRWKNKKEGVLQVYGCRSKSWNKTHLTQKKQTPAKTSCGHED